MTPPPINIDGTNENYSNVTIDGQDVTQITIDGQDVLSTIPDSALTQDLVAWYRFEGDFADSATDSSFADSTAYDLTNNGATAAASGGITDFDTGADSGEVRFDQGDFLSNSAISKTLSEYSVTFWHNADDTSFNDIFSFQNDSEQPSLALRISDDRIFWTPVDGGSLFEPSGVTSYSTNQYVFFALTHTSGTQTVYENGSQIASDTQTGSATVSDLVINARSTATNNAQPRQTDDFRIYNRELTSSEVSDIYNATKP